MLIEYNDRELLFFRSKGAERFSVPHRPKMDRPLRIPDLKYPKMSPCKNEFRYSLFLS